MSARTFVDTNVFVYARDSRDATKQAVATLELKSLWAEHRGRTSAQVLSEYYVTLTRKLVPGMSQDEAWHDVKALMAWEPQAIDMSLMSCAREVEHRYKLSWWDSMIVAAAQLQDCSVLLSEDLHHGASYGSVVVRNPFVTGVSEPFGHHEPLRVTRHRGRGRPKAPARATRL